MTQMPEKKRGQGFAAMTPERRREISSLGGQIAHEFGKAYRWNSTTARAAGAKGQEKRRANLLEQKNNPHPKPEPIEDVDLDKVWK